MFLKMRCFLRTDAARVASSIVIHRPQGERTVKRLRLSKALTIPDGTTVADACRRMATRRVTAALLTDSNALLCGIITDQDISTRVIAEGLKPEEISVSKVMTRNPVFVMGDTLAVEALQTMVQGKFRHLPVVEDGEVIALLDITKCLYDAIARVEGAAEKGNAIAAAIESVEREWSVKGSDKSNFVENLRDRMFKPTLRSLIAEGTKVATCSSSETVTTATKKMRDLRMSSVIVTSSSRKPRGILTSKDVLMKVIAQGLPPESTTLDKVMTPNPECAGLDTTLVDALHAMHDRKFLHLPVTDSDGSVVACVDVLHLTHGAVATVGGGGVAQAMATTMLQTFWDSAMEPAEDESDSPSDNSARRSDAILERPPSYPSFGPGNTFSFKLKLSAYDGKPHHYRFNCGSESLTELMSTIAQRVGDDIDLTHLPRLMYIDDEGDKVLLATDSDVVAAVNVARISGWKALTLHLEESQEPRSMKAFSSNKLSVAVDDSDGWSTIHTALITCTVAAVAFSVVFCFRRFNTLGT
uniref:CBS domain-containing protein n=1 Tax=Physcomitrium patens TaxID=3218 RepID=A0A7I4F043_PHYPA